MHLDALRRLLVVRAPELDVELGAVLVKLEPVLAGEEGSIDDIDARRLVAVTYEIGKGGSERVAQHVDGASK